MTDYVFFLFSVLLFAPKQQEGEKNVNRNAFYPPCKKTKNL